MHILYISYDGALDPLGQSQVIPYLRRISGVNIKIILMSFEKKALLNDGLFVNHTKKILSDSNIEWRPLVYHKTPSFLATLYDITMGILTAYWLTRRYKFNIIHARSYIASLIALPILKITGSKFIFDMRGFWPEERIEGGIWEKKSFFYKVSKFLEKKFIFYSDYIVVLSKKAKEMIITSYLNGIKKPVEVIPTCVDLDFFIPKEAKNNTFYSDKFLFVYSGSFGTWYCCDEMIDFFRAAKQKLENAYFMFLTANLNTQVNKLMLDNGFSKEEFIVKTLRYREVPRWLYLADASIFFISPVSSKIASCPTKLGESLACGLPVIINSGIGDTQEIVEKEKVGVVIKGFSESEYINAIDKLEVLLLDKDNLKQRCRLTAEKLFSLVSGVNKYIGIYDNLIT